MSEPEGFLARWSRRKREGEPPAPAPDATPAVPDAATADVVPPDALPAQPAELEIDPASLPPVESIEAGTDIRAFLARGVPADLAREALRRAWVTDPAIRDFVGLADYAWDFNAPDSMPGFGPLETTDDLRRLMSQLACDDLAAAAPAAEPAAAQKPPAESPPPPSSPPSSSAQTPVPERSTEETAPEPRPAEKAAEKIGPDDSTVAAMQNRHSDTDSRETVLLPARRSHGGALPE
jgi:hypothetical protein